MSLHFGMLGPSPLHCSEMGDHPQALGLSFSDHPRGALPFWHSPSSSSVSFTISFSLSESGSSSCRGKRQSSHDQKVLFYITYESPQNWVLLPCPVLRRGERDALLTSNVH